MSEKLYKIEVPYLEYKTYLIRAENKYAAKEILEEDSNFLKDSEQLMFDWDDEWEINEIDEDGNKIN